MILHTIPCEIDVSIFKNICNSLKTNGGNSLNKRIIHGTPLFIGFSVDFVIFTFA